MLTPDKIKSKTFQTTATGSYRSEDVNNFFEEVAVSYEQLFRENGSLIKKLSLLANKVEEYKKDEDSLRHALLAAQKLADQIVAEAKESAESKLSQAKSDAAEIVTKANDEAEKVLDEAKNSAAKLVNDARYTAEATIHNANMQADELLGGINRKATQEKLIYDMLQKEVSDFREKLMGLYEEHLLLLDKIPSIVKESREKVDNNKVVEVTPETVEENVISEPEKLEVDESEDTENEAVEAESVEAACENEAENIAAQDDIEESFELTDFNFEDETEIEDEDNEGFVISDDVIDDEADEAAFSLTEIEDEIDDIDDIEAELVDSFGETSNSPEIDGFSLDLSDLDFEEEPDVDSSEENEDQDIKSKYASLDEEFEEDDDDDDGAISFKKFFRKK